MLFLAYLRRATGEWTQGPHGWTIAFVGQEGETQENARQFVDTIIAAQFSSAHLDKLYALERCPVIHRTEETGHSANVDSDLLDQERQRVDGREFFWLQGIGDPASLFILMGACQGGTTGLAWSNVSRG